jgi:hypothetical protein
VPGPAIIAFKSNQTSGATLRLRRPQTGKIAQKKKKMMNDNLIDEI